MNDEYNGDLSNHNGPTGHKRWNYKPAIMEVYQQSREWGNLFSVKLMRGQFLNLPLLHVADHFLIVTLCCSPD